MRLARINHNRCDEPSGATYVWVPDDMTEEEFDSAVERASDAYLMTLQDWENRAKGAIPFPHFPPYDAHPEKTVGHVKQIWEEQKAAYREQEAKVSEYKKPFGGYLVDEGLTNFYDYEPELEGTVYWGHRHSTTIDYSATEANKKDLKGPYVYKPKVKVVRAEKSPTRHD